MYRKLKHFARAYALACACMKLVLKFSEALHFFEETFVLLQGLWMSVTIIVAPGCMLMLYLKLFPLSSPEVVLVK